MFEMGNVVMQGIKNNLSGGDSSSTEINFRFVNSYDYKGICFYQTLLTRIFRCLHADMRLCARCST